MAATSLDQVVALAKRRGFIYPSSEIYGGIQGVFDYGPLGVELKNNITQDWWRANVYERDDMEGLDAAILMNRLVWKYSGHEETFVDPMVDCRNCKSRWREDQIHGTCPNCGSKDLTEPRPFNMMFKTAVGPIADADSFAYLRPETAQGIFVNFANVLSTTSRKLPFGIAQIGKGFRNEINPRNFLFRVREFDMLEIEYFVMPGTEDDWHQRWLDTRLRWWESIGVSRERIQVYDVPKADLAHYSKRTFDLMYNYPTLGYEEIEGIASRSDFDLGSHSKDQDALGLAARVSPNTHSTARLTYFDPTSNRHVVPFVVEPSAGVGRCFLAVLCEAYDEQMVKPPADEKLAAVADALAAFLKSAGRSEKISAEARDALLARGEAIAADLPSALPQVESLLAMAGADQIELGKKLRGQAQPLRRSLPHGAAPAPAPGADQGGGLPAQAQPRGAGVAGQGHSQVAPVGRPDARGLRRHRRDRQAVPPPGRDRYAILPDGRFSVARRPDRDGARPRYDGPGARAGGRAAKLPGGAASVVFIRGREVWRGRAPSGCPSKNPLFRP